MLSVGGDEEQLLFTRLFQPFLKRVDNRGDHDNSNMRLIPIFYRRSVHSPGNGWRSLAEFYKTGLLRRCELGKKKTYSDLHPVGRSISSRRLLPQPELAAVAGNEGTAAAASLSREDDEC